MSDEPALWVSRRYPTGATSRKNAGRIETQRATRKIGRHGLEPRPELIAPGRRATRVKKGEWRAKKFFFFISDHCEINGFVETDLAFSCLFFIALHSAAQRVDRRILRCRTRGAEATRFRSAGLSGDIRHGIQESYLVLSRRHRTQSKERVDEF